MPLRSFRLLGGVKRPVVAEVGFGEVKPPVSPGMGQTGHGAD